MDILLSGIGGAMGREVLSLALCPKAEAKVAAKGAEPKPAKSAASEKPHVPDIPAGMVIPDAPIAPATPAAYCAGRSEVSPQAT